MCVILFSYDKEKRRELERKSTVVILETVQMEGKRKVSRRIECYTLDAILSVGYRVNSKQATQFRIWATQAEITRVFGVTSQNITMHLKHIYADKELSKSATSKDSLQVRQRQNGRTCAFVVE
jgi:hypothetical protein